MDPILLMPKLHNLAVQNYWSHLLHSVAKSKLAPPLFTIHQ